MILADFFATRIHFIGADPDPADQNETDPDPQHWLKDTYSVNLIQFMLSLSRIYTPGWNRFVC